MTNLLGNLFRVRIWRTCLFVFLGLTSAYAQKPALTAYDIDYWPSVRAECISNDGHYLAYSTSLQNAPDHSLFIRSLNDSFVMQIELGEAPFFTEDNQEFLYMVHDTLRRIDLRSRRLNFISGVRSYKIPVSGRLPVLAYQQNNGRLIVLNRLSDKQIKFDQVKDYRFSDNGKVLLVFQQKGSSGETIQWLDLATNEVMIAWNGPEVLQYTLSPLITKMALLIAKDDTQRHCTIWEFDSRKNNAAKELVGEDANQLEPGYSVSNGELHYSPDGTRLFFYECHLADSITPKLDAIKVDIWNYRDEYLQSDQLNILNEERNRKYFSVVNVSSDKVMRLEQYQDGLLGENVNDQDNDNYVLTCSRSNIREYAIYPKERSDTYLVDTRTGERIRIFNRVMPGESGQFSSGGKYVFRYDSESGKLIFYNIAKRHLKTIAWQSFAQDSSYSSSGRRFFYGFGGWMSDDKAVFVYSKFDIWQVDPEVNTSPVNLTNGYGRVHGIYLRMVSLGWDLPKKVEIKGSYILCASDDQTKANGFFRMRIGHLGNPERLSMAADMMYFAQQALYDADADVEPNDVLIKARDADVYILMKQSAEISPNIVATHNFKTFMAITDMAPEKKVNWLTSELVRWKTLDGMPGQGILYKPDDFDSTKRYPVIFYFYELLSGKLHKYLNPDWGGEGNGGRINIPWFVSHGYLVFCPDIVNEMGDPGKGPYNYVVSAAELMMQKPWVDGSHMAVQGHSFGGYEVNYLVSKTSIFAAAAEASGAADLISNSGEPELASCGGQMFTETGYRMEVPFWKNLKGYIDNSPLFGVENVTTPLLMMNNKKDGAVPWSQGVEFFTALRRLGKTVFMFQYDDGGHVLFGQNAMDYTTRLMQFFDHYLKGAPEPKWMAEGIPARLKGIDDGLELEPATETKAETDSTKNNQ